MIATLYVDLQGDFVDGKLPVPGAKAILPRVNDHMRQYERLKVGSRDGHAINAGTKAHLEEYGEHCMLGTPGHRFHSGFQSGYLDCVVDKGREGADPSAFDGRDRLGNSLDDLLEAKDITEIEVCGIATDVCVLATCLSGLRLGYDVTLLVGLTAAIGGKEGYRDAVRKVLDAGGWVR